MCLTVSLHHFPYLTIANALLQTFHQLFNHFMLVFLLLLDFCCHVCNFSTTFSWHGNWNVPFSIKYEIQCVAEQQIYFLYPFTETGIKKQKKRNQWSGSATSPEKKSWRDRERVYTHTKTWREWTRWETQVRKRQLRGNSQHFHGDGQTERLLVKVRQV